MLRFVLKKVLPLPKLTQFDRYLFVGPHPDDIEVACGATVATLTRLGKQVTFLIATNGCVGSVDPTLTSQQLVKLRQQEALASAQVLGVSDVRFLPYDDGEGYDCKDMQKDVVSVILELRPQVVFCPDYCVASECHPDHLNVGKVATNAVFYANWDKLTSRLNMSGSVKNVYLAYYYTNKPNCYVKVNKTYKLHLQSIACHKSQFTQNDLDSYKSYFSLRQICFGARKLMGRADGYRVLSPMHQHCLPEASDF